MHLNFIKNTVLLFVLTLLSCRNQTNSQAQSPLRVGAQQTETYLPILKNKTVGILANQTSVIFKEDGYTHLVDSLLSLNVAVKKVFAPEHGFRGTADAGEKVESQTDPKTGLSIISLYGKNRKPTPLQLKGIDVLVFDLQDVGARFYTYLSTLHYVMEACAENDISLIVLDRPNPNIHYVDGPVLGKKHTSFVGMHPVPIVYGMTIVEYAQMINGEGWLEGAIQCYLKIIPIKNYSRNSSYELLVRPSPNLPNAQAVALYPSLCLLEPTVISVGRGTDHQFQIYGHPLLPKDSFSFTPQPNFGSKNPKQKGVLCFGENLTQISPPKKVELKWLLKAYQNFPSKDDFFLKGFERIAGNSSLKKQIKKGMTEEEIQAWTKTELFKNNELNLFNES